MEDYHSASDLAVEEETCLLTS